ncbi:MAG TPA: PAS domain S-box protein [Candidatus Bathyarchaeia archaeon]|nr:PAS domain S-box protein [Candidatus Bathyarchaeia archaeon]
MESDRQDGAATDPGAGPTRAEQVLRANQQLLEPAADANPSMLYLYSLPERRTIYMNDRIEALLGYSREEIVAGGRDFVRSLFHPDDLPAVRRQPGEYQTLGDGAVRRREYRIKHRDGGWRWFHNRESVFSRDDQGNPELILGASEDVTDQVEAESALRASQRLFARVADTVPSIVYVYDLSEQRCVFVNRQLEATLGYPIEQFQRNPFGVIDEFVHEDDRQDLAASVAGGLAGVEDGRVLEREFRLRDARGEWRWLHTRHVVFARTPTGGVRQILGVADDVTERTRAEQALSESQAFFKKVVNAAPIVLYLHDQTTKQDLFVNDQAEAVFGRPPEIGHDGFLDLVHPEDIDHLIGAGERLAAAAEGGVVETEFRARHASGEWRWYQDRVVALTRTADGKPVRVLGAIQDTTDRRLAEEAIREREHLLERVADSLPQLVYLFDLSAGRLQYVNRQVSKMLGYSPEEMKKPGDELLNAIVHPEDRRSVKLLFPADPAALDGAGAIEFECRVRHANGDWRWLLCRNFVFTRAADGSAEQVLGTIDDVTEHKLAGENLVRFSLAIESSSDAIAMADATGRVTYVNPRFADLFGYTAEDLNVVHPAVRLFDEETETAMREAIFAGCLWTREVELKVKSGRAVPCLLRVGPIQDAAGQMVGFYSVTTDITERRQREEQARQHQAELTHAQRISTLGEMAAGLAHELNQPLSAIASYASGCARRIRSGAGDPGELLAVVEQISEEALRGGEIIRRLKELVQKRDLRREPVDVNSLVHDVVHLVESDVRQGDVAVQLELAERLPRPGADRIQVEQVLLNLVRNALESMHQCGNGHGAGPRAELSIRTAQLDGDTIELRIRDSGSGVPEDLAERIFEPFFSTKAEGLGMGLSISRSIIEAHGGRLWATINEDAGTTFHVTLPLGTAPPREESVR